MGGRALKLVAGVLIAGVSFVGSCLALRGVLPFPEIGRIHAKLMQFREHGSDYDTLFVGSSRIHHQVKPVEFDALMAAAGQPTKSFNAGVAGMRPPEDSFFFDQLLAARPQHLRWVFLEVNNIRPKMDADIRGTRRAQYWHDWTRLSLIWRRLEPAPPRNAKKRRTLAQRWREWQEPLAEFSEHLGLFVVEMTNLGKGDFLTQWLVAKPVPWRQTMGLQLGPELAGWVPTGRGEAMTPANQEAVEKGRAERLAQPAEHRVDEPVSQEALEGMITKVEQLGATPVLIVAPVTSKWVFYPRPERLQKTRLLDFNDPQKFPELYENRNRLDPDHLNSAGAEVFTRLLAQEWLKARAAHP